MILVKDVSKHFGEVIALESVSLTLNGPGLATVLGPNGAGKTTLLDLLEGLTEPTSGTVSLFGKSIGLHDYPRQRVGVVMQREFILDGMTVRDYADLFASIYKLSRDGSTRILKRAELIERSKAPIEQISGGEAQRLFIAAASVHEPELLLLDEPTSELDPENKLRVGELLSTLAKTARVVMTTHDLDEAERLAEEVIFLFDGRIRAHGTQKTLLRELKKDDATLRDAFFHYCGRTIARGGESL